MYKDYKPNPLIISRAVELWVEMLSAPKNNTSAVLLQFGYHLRKILMNPFAPCDRDKDDGCRDYPRELRVNYHPCMALLRAAERSGLKMKSPCKTNMWIRGDGLEVSAEYGAPCTFHYPLRDGRWLVTSLCGDDIDKVFRLVEDGVLTTDLVAATAAEGS